MVWKKFNILLVFLLGLGLHGFCANNSISLQVNTGLNFQCNTATALESTQTLANAFTINIVNGSKKCTVYARISAFNHPPDWVLVGNYPLSLIYVSDNSPNNTNTAATTILTTTDQMLFKQPKHNNTYSFNYSLRLAALGYAGYKPGNYNYTITFTMTEP